jgi:hypothetical protein
MPGELFGKRSLGPPSKTSITTVSAVQRDGVQARAVTP